MNRRQFAGFLGAASLPTAPSPFLAEPYLNLGQSPSGISIIFHVPPSQASYAIRANNQLTQTAPSGHVHTAELPHIPAGQNFQYEVLRNGQPIFRATAKSRPSKGQPFRTLLFGDSGQDTTALHSIAAQAHAQNPDLFLHLGDIAYQHGRTVEYRQNFFPIYKFLPTRLSVSVPGNHDVDKDDCGTFSDAYAWFDYWKQPNNGPGNNFSFECGDAHWTVIDSNRHANLADPALRHWLDKTLSSVTAAWNLVAVHHPPFTSGSHHGAEQQSRQLCDLVQKHNVDAVFSGHDHNFQRTHPVILENNTPRIHPRGIPYIISGAAGADLHPAADNPQIYTNIALASHSLSVLDIQGRELLFRQIDAQGRTIDSLRLSK